MRQRTLEKADEELLEMLHSMSDVVGKSPRLHDMLSQRTSQDSTPWFERYFTQYFDLINFLPHETRDFPLVCKSCSEVGCSQGVELFFSPLFGSSEI
jgi:hypothetical protein